MIFKQANHSIIMLGIAFAFLPNSTLAERQQTLKLENVLVTAKRHEQSLQDMPTAISVLSGTQIDSMGITSLATLSNGAIPSLRIQPFGSTSSTLIVSIRGNGPSDISQVTREGSVALYVDGVYQSRAQGLSAELVDLERIEVLRGPQGTLFGRNATGGAVNIISKKPTGELDIQQTIGAGNYNALRSVTHVNLPEISGVSTKFDYVHSERDGWVKNPAPGEEDYNAYEKDGGRLSINVELSDSLMLDYSYDQTRDRSTQPYHQLYQINPFAPNIAIENGRQSRTRFPVAPLDASVVEQKAHALTASWTLSDQLSFKSITAYRDLDDEVNNNYAGVLGFNGLIFSEEVEQDQFSQEFQLLGAHAAISWTAGMFYFEEDVDYRQQNLFSLNLATTPPTPISPPIAGPVTRTTADAHSYAVYGQVVWSPASFNEKLHLTTGLRYTEDEKTSKRDVQNANLDDSHLDGGVTLAYDWQDELSTYIKWSTAYKAGGVSLRGVNFVPYDNESAETWEAGLKTEFWSQRARLNAAVFFTEYEDLQLDFSNPAAPGTSDTINARNAVGVDGFELDLTVVPLPGLVIAMSYSYMDGDMPLQPNPLDNNILTEFEVAQTPQHAGALSVDYTFTPMSYGTVTTHLDMTSTDQYAYVVNELTRRDAYTLFNMRLTLADIKIGHDRGSFDLSAWVKNLTDEEYIALAFPVSQFYGDPRTYGVDIIYKF